MKQFTLSALVCTLGLLAGCNGQVAPGTTPGGQTTQTRLKLSELKFDSPWIRSCVDGEIRQQKIQYADELTRLSCRGYPKAFYGYFGKSGGEDMLVDSTGGIEQLTALKELDLSDNYINQIDLSKLKNLTTLDLSGNLLQNLDLSNYSTLKNLYLSQNPLHTLKLPRNGQLESLRLGFESYTGNFQGYSALKSYLTSNSALLKDARFFDEKTGNLLSPASFQRIGNIDFSQQSRLKSFTAIDLALHEKSFAFESFPTVNALENLDLQLNNLTAVNLSKLSKLKTLNLNSNTILSLDITANPNLEDLGFAYNRFSSIKAQPNNKLKTLNILDTFVSDEDLKSVFDSKTLTSVSMPSGELLPVALAPNLASLTLTNTGLFASTRLSSARNLKELTLYSGSIDSLAVYNLPLLEQVNLKLSQQKSPILVSCVGSISSVDVTLTNMVPSESNLSVSGTKGCAVGKINITTYSSAGEIDLADLDVEEITITSNETRYTDIALPSNAKSITLDGINELDRFSFYEFSQLEILKLKNAYISGFGFKGASRLKEFGLYMVKLDQLSSGAAPDSLTTLSLEYLNLSYLDLSSIAKSLTTLRLYGCTIDNFISTTFNPGISLDVRGTRLEAESLATFKRVSGRNLDSAGNLIPLQK